MKLETAIEHFPDSKVIDPSQLYKGAKTSVAVSHQMLTGKDAKPMIARLHGQETADEKQAVIVVYDRDYAVSKLRFQLRDVIANVDEQTFMNFMSEVYDK
jgi:hypothetical protein